MKRKRTNQVEEDPHKRSDFYNKDELFHLATTLQMEFNREFGINYSDVSILRYVQEQTQLETIAKINIIMQACITEKIYKSLEDIKEIINTSINT
jgi:hypothetical protein|tara:strand:- start:4032 stop:4316 length:285 start_codon:yes stop_codon:yes gene_type:complete